MQRVVSIQVVKNNRFHDGNYSFFDYAMTDVWATKLARKDANKGLPPRHDESEIYEMPYTPSYQYVSRYIQEYKRAYNWRLHRALTAPF